MEYENRKVLRKKVVDKKYFLVSCNDYNSVEFFEDEKSLFEEVKDLQLSNQWDEDSFKIYDCKSGNEIEIDISIDVQFRL